VALELLQGDVAAASVNREAEPASAIVAAIVMPSGSIRLYRL